MFDLIALCDDVVVAWNDTTRLIKIAFGVQRSYRRHTAQDLGIATDHFIGADADKGACVIGQHQTSVNEGAGKKKKK